jgi:hypothetical protein
MTISTLPDSAFNAIMTVAEQKHHDAMLKANQAFARAMNRAIRRGKVQVTPGTFVDTSPAIYAKRLRGEVAISPCGSPAAMCVEKGAHEGGAGTLK